MHSLFLREDPSHKYLVYRAGSYHPVKAFFDRRKAKDWCINMTRREGVEFSYIEG